MQQATALIDKDWQFVHGKEPYFSSMLVPPIIPLRCPVFRAACSSGEPCMYDNLGG